ncbi:RICIN domain-containing protein, partial [Roseisolibacter agri]|uniref:RICIN domain-containing protein n=1 Tax=Roseisolibacter agri TaxID=2014610 RepID=UPI0024E113AE
GYLCLAAAGTEAGARLTTAWCEGQATQRWTLTSAGQLQQAGGALCAAPAGGATANDTRIVLAECGSAAGWRIAASTAESTIETPGSAPGGVPQLRNDAAERCLNVAGAATNAGAPVIVYDCAGGVANERWSVGAVGQAQEVR